MSIEEEEKEQAFRERLASLTDKELVKLAWLFGLVANIDAQFAAMGPDTCDPDADAALADIQDMVRAELKKRSLAKSRSAS